jgi:hypothetical protein
MVELASAVAILGHPVEHVAASVFVAVARWPAPWR